MEPERLLRKEEARKRLDITLGTLDGLIERGVLPVVRLSRKAVRIRESAIADLIERRERGVKP
jgi:excisionase family DNA binding protein